MQRKGAMNLKRGAKLKKDFAKLKKVRNAENKDKRIAANTRSVTENSPQQSNTEGLVDNICGETRKGFRGAEKISGAACTYGTPPGPIPLI